MDTAIPNHNLEMKKIISHFNLGDGTRKFMKRALKPRPQVFNGSMPNHISLNGPFMSFEEIFLNVFRFKFRGLDIGSTCFLSFWNPSTDKRRSQKANQTDGVLSILIPQAIDIST